MSEEFVISMVYRGVDQMTQPARQMDQALQSLSRTNRDVTRSTQGAARETNLMGDAIKATIAAVTIGKVKQFAEEFYDLGSQVKAADELFQHFGGNDDVLAKLRAETRGLADDLTLMRASSDLMNLGIARNTDDAGRLIGMIAAVKKPYQELGDVVTDFSLLIANQSYLRLDTFGISSTQVRDRVQELKDTLHMDNEAAFFQATMEALEGKVTSLGDAAYAGETALKKLQVGFENAAQQGAEKFATVIDQAITALTQLGVLVNTGNLGALFGNEPVQATQGREDEAYARGVVIAEQFKAGFETTLSDDGLRSYIENYVKAIGSDGTLPEISSENMASWMGLRSETLLAEPGLLQELQHITVFTTNQVAQMNEASRINARNLELDRQRLAIMTEEMRATADGARLMQQRAEAARQLAEDNARLDPFTEAYQRLYTLQHELGTQRGALLFTPQEAADAQALAERVEALYQAAGQLHDTDVISDEAFERIQQMREGVSAMADDVERGADAWMRMSLSDLLGKQGGGQLGEIGDLILGAAEKNGMKDADLLTLREAWDLATGRETGFSQALTESVAALANLPPEQQIEAAKRFVESLQAYRLAGGVPQNLLPGDVNFMMGFAGSGGGRQVDVKAGDTQYSLANRYGGSIEDYRSLLDSNGYLQPGQYQLGGGLGGLIPGFDATGSAAQLAEMRSGTSAMVADMESIAASAPTAADAFGQMSDSAADIQEKTGGIRDFLEEIASSVYDVAINLNVTYPAILDVILGNNGAASLNQIVRGNGGRVPGSDPRARQIER